MAVSESQLKKMVSKVSPRRTGHPARAHHSPWRRRGLAGLSPARLLGRPEAQCSPQPPLRPQPRDACRLVPESPLHSRGRRRRGAATVNKGAELRPPVTCRPPPSLRVEFGTVCVGQCSFRPGFYKHRERGGLNSPSEIVLHRCPSVGIRPSSPFRPGPRRLCLFQFYVSHTAQYPTRGGQLTVG